MAKLSTAKVFKQQLDPSAAFKPGESLENTAVNVNNALEGGDALTLNAQAFVSNHIEAPQTFVKRNNETVSALPSQQTTSGEFPVYIIVIIAIVSFVMTSTFFYFLCRCLVRRKKRENQLANLTPKSTDHRMTGVRANQPIEFVVPTTVIVSETTEDSVSETDYSSSGAKNLPIIMDRRRKRPGFQINPEELQHGLYVGVTAASEKGSFIGDLGKVGFSLRYNLQRNQLIVKIIGAKDLPCQIMRTTANPCVKVVLLPDRTTKYMTKVMKNTTCPVFNEAFTFCVRRDELPNKKMKISVWDYDRFSRKCLIGQVVYNVRDSGLTNTLSLDATTGEIWVDMKPDSAVVSDIFINKFVYSYLKS